LVWLHVEIKTPPFSKMARLEAGFLLLRITDSYGDWRIIYRADSDAIIIAAVFEKKTRKTPQDVMTVSRDRLRRYDHA